MSNTFILFTYTRLYYVAAKEGHMVEAFSMIHIRKYTPTLAIIVTVMNSEMKVI